VRVCDLNCDLHPELRLTLGCVEDVRYVELLALLRVPAEDVVAQEDVGEDFVIRVFRLEPGLEELAGIMTFLTKRLSCQLEVWHSPPINIHFHNSYNF
jgi:hypothetical protein